MRNLYKLFLSTLILTASASIVYSQNFPGYQGSQYSPSDRSRGGSFQQDQADRGYNQSRTDQGNFRNQDESDSQNPNNRFMNSPSNSMQNPQNPSFNRFSNANNPRMNSNRMIADSTSQATAEDTDSAIVQQIRDRLKDDHYLAESSKNIQITSTDGNVGLRGTVHSNEEKTRIESIVKNINGVKNVGNNLQVQ